MIKKYLATILSIFVIGFAFPAFATTQTFNQTNASSVVNFTVPSGVTSLSIVANGENGRNDINQSYYNGEKSCGAWVGTNSTFSSGYLLFASGGGGRGNSYSGGPALNGSGSTVSGLLSVSPGQTYYIQVCNTPIDGGGGGYYSGNYGDTGGGGGGGNGGSGGGTVCGAGGQTTTYYAGTRGTNGATGGCFQVGGNGGNAGFYISGSFSSTSGVVQSNSASSLTITYTVSASRRKILLN
jgi:hypothetical protein